MKNLEINVSSAYERNLIAMGNRLEVVEAGMVHMGKALSGVRHDVSQMVQNFGALVQGINTKFVDLENRLGNPMVSAALNEKEILHNQNVIWKEMEKIHKLVLSERNFPSSSVSAVEEGKNAEIHTQTSCGGTLFPSRNAKSDGQIGNHTRRGGKETFFEHARFPQHMDEHQPSIPHSVTRERSIPASNCPSSFVGHMMIQSIQKTRSLFYLWIHYQVGE